MMKGGLGNIMKQAQAMQENLRKAQEELAHIEVNGSAAGGLGQVVVACRADSVSDSPAIEGLKQALRRLPGVGPKSAQRMAFHLLARDRDGARQIAEALRLALERVGHCQPCNDFSEDEICPLCASPRRDHALLCVVESPADLSSIEQSGAYHGHYFLLMGRLSPLDGIGPDEIGIQRLQGPAGEGRGKEGKVG